MDEEVISILRVADAAAAVTRCGRPRSVRESKHRFGPGFPTFVTIIRGRMRLLRSEHGGDARLDTLIRLRLSDVEAIAGRFATVDVAPWSYENQLRDPDGIRLRIGSPYAAGG